MRSRDGNLQLFFPWRLALLALVMLACFGVLASKLWALQMTQPGVHQARMARQSIRSVRLPGVRGRILDRNGVALADNDPSYCLSIYVETLRRSGPRQRTVDAVMDTIDRLAETMDRPATLTRQDVLVHLNRRTPLPLVAWSGLDETAVARFAEHADEFEGVELTVEPSRNYPHGSLAAHVIGYVGRANEASLAEAEAEEAEATGEEAEDYTYSYYLPDLSGREGLEKSLDEDLRAPSGGRLEMQIDVAGFKYREIEGNSRPAGQGKDVRLALDVRIQQAAEAALSGRRGAVVVVDPRNGDVLAMASAPAYDLNRFVPRITRADWNELMNSPDHPLINRATQGGYAPGSTFKPITLLAAMHSGAVRPDRHYDCTGTFMLGSKAFHCAQKWGHGSIDLPLAIRYSCNVYLYHAALACGPEPIQEMARYFGLGRKTGICLGERSGLVPDDAWKRKNKPTEGGWQNGDTCNIAIGQGALVVTPLQIAMYTAALANGGTLWKPRLVLSKTDADGHEEVVPPEQVVHDGPVPWTAADMAVVRRGMRDVVQTSDGSGRRARVDDQRPGFELAAKTGTAEHGIKGSGQKWTWLIAFAPYDAPRYALAFLVEEGDSGGSTVAPLVRKLFIDILENVEPSEGAADDAEGEEAAA